jgi:thiol-disulfide isomerase/thioredoxin
MKVFSNNAFAIRALAFCVFCALLPTILAAPSPVPRLVPKFQVRLLDGKIVTEKSLLGSVTVIDFWGTWCKPCLMEIPDYNEFYRTYKNKGVRFIALAVESGTTQEVAAAARQLKIEYPVGVVSPEDLSQYFGDLYMFPTTWIIDAQGNLQKEFLGVTANKHRVLREIVDRLLQ